MRRKVRGTLQINEDVKRLFMLAKPLEVTSSDFLKGLLASHVRELRASTQKSPPLSIPVATTERLTCLGRPPGARDLRPRARRTKKQLALLYLKT